MLAYSIDIIFWSLKFDPNIPYYTFFWLSFQIQENMLLQKYIYLGVFETCQNVMKTPMAHIYNIRTVDFLSYKISAK